MMSPRILIIEDEHLIAQTLGCALRVSGVEIAGMVGTVEQALALLCSMPKIDGALLDINLRGKLAYAVADDLIARGLPFVFTTGYSAPVIPKRYQHVPVLQKPFDPNEILTALFPNA